MTDDQSGASDGPGGEIFPISITDEMKRSYVDYAMSVIVSRALPDVRDGLKPVHRRIVYTMHEQNNAWNRPYRKSADTVGKVMGQYHPHGDSAIYDALVRMAQDFSMSVPLIDGQGNFGSMDGDSAAAMRYTEVRMAKITHSFVEDIDKETVAFQPNYADTMLEPTVLPARFPNILVNGAGGIAVGMATNIPPHNLGEVIDGALALIEDPALSLDRLIEIIPGPDFPTGGQILGRSGIRDAYTTGRGSVMMRGRVTTESVRSGREALIVTEIPYQVNKATMVTKIAELAREKRVEGIADVRDESNLQGVRVVIELKRDAMADVVLNQLYRYTPLQTSFGANLVALNGGRPEQMTLIDILRAFVAFREHVVSQRTKYLLRKARDRAHALVGLAIAVANIDEVINLIRTSPDPATARARLMERDWPARDMAALIVLIADPRHALSDDGTYRLSEEQARAILELRLQRLTALGRDEIADELNSIAVEVKDYLEILASRARIMGIVADEMTAIRDEFAVPRRTELIEAGPDLEDEDLIQREDMVVTVTHGGYIKRVPLDTYRAQRRGGKGRSGVSMKEEDFVTRLFVANTHTPMLFFSSRGLVYKMKVWRLPLAAPQARGKALVNLLPLDEAETITSVLPLPDDENLFETLDLVFATQSGMVRRNKLVDFVNVNRNGKIAMKLDEGDGIVGVDICTDRNDVLLTTSSGRCIRFPVDAVRVFAGRNSVGVRGINMDKGDRVISLSVLRHFEATPDERVEYLRRARAVRGEIESEENGSSLESEEGAYGGELAAERYAEMGASEQFVLTVSENGFGKRSSTFEYRVTGRGGKGLIAMVVNDRNGPLVASFPVEDGDQIMLVTDRGQLIRTTVDDIRIAGRSTQGVTLFRTADDERVVAVEHISEPEEVDDDDDEDGVEGDGDGGVDGGDAPDGDAPESGDATDDDGEPDVD